MVITWDGLAPLELWCVSAAARGLPLLCSVTSSVQHWQPSAVLWDCADKDCGSSLLAASMRHACRVGRRCILHG